MEYENNTATRYVELLPDESYKYYEEAYKFVENSANNIKIINGPIGSATKEEFLRSEQKINEIIDKINPEWSIKQKVAYVYYEIGKIISYVPNFVFTGKDINSRQTKDVRNIWKSIDSGVSVCNGITSIQRTILSRMGIKTRELSSGTHSFVLVETKEGNIITDATWDLTSILFGARPFHFGKTYEQLRECDGPFSKAHELEQPPENVIEISEEELRKIYHSIGITNEDKTFKFPILKKIDEINSKEFTSNEEKIDNFLEMFTQEFSREATHLSETRRMLEQCISEFGIKSKNITTQFVYKKNEEEIEKTYLCMHIDYNGMREKIKILNLEQMKFENIDLVEFDDLYKTHDLDTREPFWKKYLQKKENIKQAENDKSEK